MRSFGLFLCFSAIVDFFFTLLFFYTLGSLVGQDSKRQGIKLAFSPQNSLFLSCSLNSFHVFNTQGSQVKDPLGVSYYLDYSSFLYLYECSTKVSLVCPTLVSKVSYYLDIYSLLYLCGFGKRLLQGVALFQTSLRFSTFTSLAQEFLKVSHYLSLFLLLYKIVN